MIDRPARDWMANLIDRTLAGEFDPASGIPFPENPHIDSRDPLIQWAEILTADYCAAPNQLNGFGTYPVIANQDDLARKLKNLTLFLRSDLQYENPKTSPVVKAVLIILSLLVVTLIGLFLTDTITWETLKTLALGLLLIAGLGFIFFYWLGMFLFAWQRWVRPPKLHTDESDHWPFKSFADLQAEREKQNPSQS